MARNKVYISRHLSEAFEDAIRDCRVIMFSAPAGNGKSVVAKTLLNRAKRDYVKISAQDPNFADELVAALPEMPGSVDLASFKWADYPCVLIDDLEQLEITGDDMGLRMIMSRNPLVQFVMCGHCSLPEWLGELQVARLAHVFEPADLSFDEQVLAVAAKDRELELSETAVDRILGETMGYPPLTLMVLDILARDGNTEESFNRAMAAALQEFHSMLEDVRHVRYTTQEMNYLMSLAPFSKFDLDLAEAVTGDSNVRHFLRKLVRGSRMVRHLPLASYEFWPILRDYLLGCMQTEFTPAQQNALYRRAADYYEENDSYFEAVRWYDACGMDEKVVDVLTRHSLLNVREGNYRELAPYYDALDPALVKASASLMSGMAMLDMIRCDFDASNAWYDELVAYAKRSDITPDERMLAHRQLGYLDIALPQRPMESVLATPLAKSKSLGKGEKPFSFSVTSGLPSVLNGGRDLSGVVRGGLPAAEKIKGVAGAVMGPMGVDAAECGVLEVRFLMGEDVSKLALEVAAGVSEVHLNGHVDTEFAMVALLVQIEVEQGNLAVAKSLVATLKSRYQRDGFDFFIPNLEALQTWLDLFDGQVAPCRRWGVRIDRFESDGLWSIDRFEQRVLAELRLAQGEPEAALAILDRWRPVFEACHGVQDLAMCNLLSAVALERLGRDWKPVFHAALDAMAELGFVRIVSQYGGAILHMVEDCDWSGDAEFLERVRRAARRQAALYPRHLLPEDEVPVRVVPKLTNTELKVLRLLCDDLSNAQIMEELDIRLPTVKTHVLHIMKKLDARSRGQAKTIAGELGIV